MNRSDVKVILYTTPGCEGCRIMRKLANKAAAIYNLEIGIEELGFDEKSIEKAKSWNITDYPTLRVYNDKKLVCELTGTYPVEYISSKISSCL